MSPQAVRRNRDDRELSLILTDSGAELIDNESGVQLWASDSDDTFREEFPDVRPKLLVLAVIGQVHRTLPIVRLRREEGYASSVA